MTTPPDIAALRKLADDLMGATAGSHYMHFDPKGTAGANCPGCDEANKARCHMRDGADAILALLDELEAAQNCIESWRRGANKVADELHRAGIESLVAPHGRVRILREERDAAHAEAAQAAKMTAELSAQVEALSLAQEGHLRLAEDHARLRADFERFGEYARTGIIEYEGHDSDEEKALDAARARWEKK